MADGIGALSVSVQSLETDNWLISENCSLVVCCGVESGYTITCCGTMERWEFRVCEGVCSHTHRSWYRLVTTTTAWFAFATEMFAAGNSRRDKW
jgi:hypothetical protein